MTTPGGFLATSTEIEKKIAELYGEFARRFADDSELEDLFLRLEEEENSHAGALELVSRVLRGFKGRFEIGVKFDAIAIPLARDLDKTLLMLKEGKEISPSSALKLAIKLESTLIEQMGEGLFETDNPELLKTFKILRDQTGDHKNRLLKFLETRKAG